MSRGRAPVVLHACRPLVADGLAAALHSAGHPVARWPHASPAGAVLVLAPARAEAACPVGCAAVLPGWEQAHPDVPTVVVGRPTRDHVWGVAWDQGLEALTSAVVAASEGRRPTAAAARLTARETDVLRLLARGCTTRQIAEHLDLSVSTVRTHTQSILTKLDVAHRSAAVAAARLAGYLDDGAEGAP